MRILYVVPRYWPSVGGAQLLTRELIHRIADRNHEVWIVTQFTSDAESFIQSVVNARPGEYQDGNINVYRIGPIGIWRSVLYMLAKVYGRLRPVNPIFASVLNRAILPQLEAIIRQCRPHVLHAVHVGLVYSSETAFLSARRSGIPFAWTPLPHIEGGGWRGPRFRRLYRKADAIIAMTEREKRWLVEQGAPANLVYTIPVGPLIHPQPDAVGFRMSHNLGQAPVILFLGQKLPYKGYRQVAQAAPLVWQQFPETRFLFIGPRTAESEKFFAGIADGRILELPAVDDFEKSSALAACDIFCMPSTQESLGVVYLEAWSFKKPVIAANIEIAREVIANGQDGLLVEQDATEIAAAILRLLRDKRQALRMGEAGYLKVQQHYNWERLIKQVESVYCSLANLGSG